MELLALLVAIVAFGAVLAQRAQVGALQLTVARLGDELAALRQQMASGGVPLAAASEPVVEASAVMAGATEQSSLGAAAPPPLPEMAIPAAEHSTAAPLPPPVAPRPFEETIGTRWAVWVGGLALALGGIFLVRYTIEAGFFGPGVRLVLASIFGIALLGAGEFLRRRDSRLDVPLFGSAPVPPILTAAGSASLFAVAYATHGIYGFVGPTAGFVLLGAIGLLTLAASLLHGPWIAALGIVGSYITPALVSSQTTEIWPLFIYVAVVLAASSVVASLRRWAGVMAAAIIGAVLWILLYILEGASPVDTTAIAFVTLAVIAATAGGWLRGDVRPFTSLWQRIGGLPGLVAGVGLVAIAAMLAGRVAPPDGTARLAMAAILVAMVGAAVWRNSTGLILSSAGASLAALAAWATLAEVDVSEGVVDGVQVLPNALAGSGYESASLVSALVVFAASLRGASVWQAATGRMTATIWSSAAAVTALGAFLLAWLLLGDWFDDMRFGVAATAGALAFLAAAELLARAPAGDFSAGRLRSPTTRYALAGGVFTGLAIHLLTGLVWTGIVIALAGTAFAAATQVRAWIGLRWLPALAGIGTLGLIAFDPTIAGEANLSTRPVLNWLLAGYGLPALFAGICAWLLAVTRRDHPQRIMEAFAILFALLGVAMLVRHFMNGGVLDLGKGIDTIDEQAIYTMIALGASMILLRLDGLSPSPVFKFGSVALGVIGVSVAAVAHFAVLNPLFTGDHTGPMPFFNALLVGYLLPGILAAAVALQGRGVRPDWYVKMMGAFAVALIGLWLGLSIRRYYQGPEIGFWRLTTGAETYTYSAAGLVAGVALLVGGVGLQSRMLRILSAIVVTLTVLKVFVIDMAALTGVLRALSFIGLGVVLIGIGLLYQRLLARPRSDTVQETPLPSAPPSDGLQMPPHIPGRP